MQKKTLLWIWRGLFVACFVTVESSAVHAATSFPKDVTPADKLATQNKEQRPGEERASVTPSSSSVASSSSVTSSSSSLYQIHLRPLDLESGIRISISLAGKQDEGEAARPPRIGAFIQKPYLWVVVTEPVIHDFSSIKDLPQGFSIPEVMEVPSGFVMRLQIPPSATPSIAQGPSGKWDLSLGTPKPQHPPGSFPFLTGKLFAFLKPPAALMINLKNVIPLKVRDPESQTQFIVVPTAEAGVGIPSVFRYADFRLLKTLQGIAFVPFSPDITLEAAAPFLKLSRKGGLNLSPAEDRQGAKSTTRGEKSFFAFEQWKMHDREKYQARKNLEDKISQAPVEDRVKEQLALAQFLISHGQGAEALNILKLISERNPRLEEDAEYACLLGLSLFQSKEMGKALEVLSNPNLPPEAELWRGAILIQLGFAKDGLVLMMKQLSTLRGLPLPLFPELALIAADGCIQNQDRSNAEKFLALLKEVPLSSAASSFLESLRERFVVLNMDPSTRESMAVQLQTKEKPHNATAKEAFLKLKAALERKKIKPEHAIDQLEALRLSWRGDELEFMVLRELATLYATQKDYTNALESLDRALRFFPHFPDKTALQEEGTRVFREGLSRMSSLQKMSFFYRFRKFLPGGDEGVKIVENLAQDLLDLDLPDQSLLILTQELKADPPPLPLLIRLATSYLNDKKPQKALEILNSPVLSSPSLNSSTLKEPLKNREELQYLRARSSYDLGQLNKALFFLEKNQSPQGQDLRFKIQWELKDWTGMVKTLREAIDRIDRLGKTDPKTLLRLAMALFQAGDQEGLREVREKYASSLTDSVQKKVFLLLTQSPYENGSKSLNIQKIKEALFQADDFQNLSSILKEETSPQ